MRRQLTRLLVLAACAAAVLIAGSSFLPQLRIGHAGRAGGPATYYVSPQGHDDAAGTTPATAWRTLRRADEAVLRPGDRLLLRAGADYTGSLKLGPRDGGNPGRPVVVGSYGGDRATISSSGSGITITDTGGITVENLTLRGHRAGATGAGVNVFSNRRAGPRFDRIVIAHVTASGFGNGIALSAAHAVGFRDVRISDARLSHNLNAGVAAFGPPFKPRAPAYAHADVVISHVTASYNRGNPAARHGNTGNGIVLGSVADAKVAWSVAHGNGGNGGARGEGPFGIWAYSSRGVVIGHDIAYGNRSNNPYDGGGFALDRNTLGCTVQYNLSYGNWGAGYQLYSSSPDAPSRNNVIRFNVSSADSRTSHESGGVIVNGFTEHSAIYQNTVIAANPPGQIHAPVYLGRSISGIVLRNNIFEGRLAGPLVLAAVPFSRGDVLFQGNDYCPAGKTWLIRWGQRAYYSLPEFRSAAAQETLGRRRTGSSADPRLVGPVFGLSFRGPNPWKSRAAFDLGHGSPLWHAGLPSPAHGTQPGHVTPGSRRAPAARPNVGAR